MESDVRWAPQQGAGCGRAEDHGLRSRVTVGVASVGVMGWEYMKGFQSPSHAGSADRKVDG